MRRSKDRSLILGVTVLFSLAFLIVAGRATPPTNIFPKKCPLPFVDPSAVHPIDSQCSPAGGTEPDNGEDTDPHLQQNRAKNHLCAPDPAVPVTITIFDALQQAVEEKEIPFGNQHIPNPEPLPPDRAELKDLAVNEKGTSVGEGTRVVFVGFVLKVKKGNPESVNCQLTGKENNDFHLVLGKKSAPPGPTLPAAEECESVTAEMIPHFRPASWDKITSATIFEKLRKHPVRITGQMFFDASHSPCGHPEFRVQGDPKRRSLWEIHPVYKMDVCKNKTLAGCRVEKEAVWTALDTWVKNPQ